MILTDTPYWAWPPHRPTPAERPPICEYRARAHAAEWADPPRLKKLQRIGRSTDQSALLARLARLVEDN